MKMNNLYEIFQALVSNVADNDSYVVDIINSSMPHRIGVTSEGFPIFFIECVNNANVSDIKLKLFNVAFNCQCSITDISVGGSTQKEYSLIQLNSINTDFQKYFLEVVYLILRKLPPIPNVSDLKTEISKVIGLFTAPKHLSQEVVKGLWAELFIIEQSKDPIYLLNSWHVEPTDKFDFNDGKDLIEVKATTGPVREHTFAIEQLHPSDGAELVISSVFVMKSPMGTNILDLVDRISNKIDDVEALIRLREIVTQTLGTHIDEVAKIYFDYNYSNSSLRFFDYRNIPKISLSDVPSGVTSIHFRSNLTDIVELDIQSSDHKLYKSL